MREICGWALLRSEKEWRAWGTKNGADYPSPPPCYPCLVKRRFMSDESTEYEYLTQGMLADMTAALAGEAA